MDVCPIFCTLCTLRRVFKKLELDETGRENFQSEQRKILWYDEEK